MVNLGNMADGQSSRGIHPKTPKAGLCHGFSTGRSASGGITLNCRLTVVAWRGDNSSSSPQVAYLLARLGFTLGTMDRTLGALEYQGGALSPSSYCLFGFFSIRFSSEVGPGEALS